MSNYATRIHELEQQVARLSKENEALKEKAKQSRKKERAEKEVAKKKSERLERGLEKLARRMDLWEKSQGIDGVPTRDAKDIYKNATGKDLGEEGYFGVEPGETWIDPRIDVAESIRWNDPSIPLDEALRRAGFDFPPTDGYGRDKHMFDSDGKSLAERKAYLRGRLSCRKMLLARKAAIDPEAAREYEARFHPTAPPPPYGGLPLDDIPDQPLVHSAASKSGYRGVKLMKGGKFSVYVGDGTDGGNRFVGS